MADNPNPQAPAAMTKEAAESFIYHTVFVPAFLEKVAANCGVTPQNEEEAACMLRIAAQVSEVDEAERVKQASVQGRMLADAEVRLSSLLGRQPPPDLGRRASLEYATKTAATLAARDDFRTAAVAALVA